MSSQDKLILYTNHRCPWAHRAHIALAELKVPFEEVIIDLDTPRTPEYLKINPRGLVPALSYNGEIIIESGIVAQFLTDAYPSHLVPASNAPGGALRRARIALFVDAFTTKFNSVLFGLWSAKTEEDKQAIVEKAVAGLVKEVEPLLADAKPFFGGSDKLTLAEVLTGSFAIRIKSLTSAEVYPRTLWTAIKEQAPNVAKWVEAVSVHPSVTSIYEEEAIVEGTRRRLEKASASA
ncbi:thioredoxin-like protein [Parathielavia appendiculata]|uniref:Thioredoxin-like protein n=1 Tax=Parathielavia appendiculata TaxID=2587402 RepID=A0AAN6U2Y3_9PEZI|nr:thioredoxin-like protein [Parathielavia appendiculata]